jgi:predicted DCC family thiol-disulfide oxidoreductase YuxK
MPLLYDGDCGFCTDAIGWMQRRFEPTAESVPAKGLDAVRWVDGGVEASGADAVAAWLRTSTRLRPVVRLIPLGLPLGRLLYPVVARNRGALGTLVGSGGRGGRRRPKAGRRRS